MNENDQSNWSRNAYLAGAALGLVMGVLAAYLFVRTAREANEAPPQIKTGDAIKLSVGIITLLRQVSGLGS